jgi:glycosyltransferase involved in cell wall biosynthesis
MKRLRKNKLLIVGKKPFNEKNKSRMGGVVVHVMRLIEWLGEQGFDYQFYDLSRFRFFSFVRSISNSEVAHLHSSSPYFRLLFAIVCKITNTQSICTYHGDLGRFGKVKNCCDELSIRYVDYPIVLNSRSLSISLSINPKAILLSAYIPPRNKEELDIELKEKISMLRNKYHILLATNAYAMGYDKNGGEIYGIKELVSIVESLPEIGLIISDPSGDYSLFYRDQLPKNIQLITEPHPFVGVLSYVDAFIRNTSTDGDSISIHEALDMGVPVIATDVVDRPKGCTLVGKGNEAMLIKALLAIKPKVGTRSNGQEKENVEIFNFYKENIFN